MQFFVKNRAIFLRIGSDRIEADEHIARNDIVFGVVERYHIRIIIMIQIFLVHLHDFVIIAEYVGQLAYFLSVAGSHAAQPRRSLPSLYGHFFYSVSLICNSHKAVYLYSLSCLNANITIYDKKRQK